jgi:ADP-ribose pyrophosphatase
MEQQTPRQHGPWTVKGSAIKYENPFIRVQEDQATRPDGQPGTYLTRQFRYAIARDSIEVVSGGIEEGQLADAAAKRELEEELGIVAEELTDLGALDLDTSVVHCPVQLFLAQSLRFASPKREGTESIHMLKLPMEEAVQQVLDCRITHGPSCALLLRVWLQRDRWC